VLICLEALSDEIINQLADIGTNLVLVPAMSAKTASMVGVVSALCARSQAFIVMANGPRSWSFSQLPVDDPSRCEAFFAGPYEGWPSSWCLPSGGGQRRPDRIALWLFRAAKRAVSKRFFPVL
jgi:hypothetical protein